MTTWDTPSPIRNYTDMAGWPGTIPTARLRRVMQAVRAGTPEDSLNQQTREDMVGIVHSHKVNMFSSGRLPTDSPSDPVTRALGNLPTSPSWEELVATAQAQDTDHTMGGIFVWKHTKTEDQSIFMLLRHPEWMGLNRILPFMQNMNVMLFESKALPGRAGLVVAQTEWDQYEKTLGQKVPEGEPTFLGKILEWHGATDIRWTGRPNKNQPR